MVRTIEQEADRVTSKLFLLSVKKWENENGIPLGVERVSNLYANKNDKNKMGISVRLSLLEEMEKCRVRVIGDNGQPIKEEDDFGEERVKTEIVDDVQEVTFFFNVSVKGMDKDSGEFIVNNKSSCFPLFNYAFMNEGSLPAGNTKGFICSIDELKDALTGLEFIGKEEDWSFSGGKPYQVLIPSDIPLKKETVGEE